jgi:NitT/TauT family transport system substrate-binding protein
MLRFVAGRTNSTKVRLRGCAIAPGMGRSIEGFARCALVAALAVIGADAHAGAQTLTPLRVSTTPIDLGAEVLYANDLGYFREAGLDVDVTVLANGASVAASVASGAEDIGEANLVSLASAHANGVPFVVVAPAGNYTSKAPTTVMVTANSSRLRTAKDLDGKTVGVVAVKDITQIGASAWIDKTGGNLASVKFIEIPQPAMCTAITSGRVDAGVVSEPFLSIALANGCRVLAACHDSIAKDFLVGAWFANGAWANEHADQIQRFRAVIAKTARWANTHHSESQRILEKYTKATIPPGMTRVPFPDTLEVAQMQPLISAAARYGASKVDFPAKDLLPAH